jgi:hypothetical protein
MASAGVVSFIVKGGLGAASRVVDAMKVARIAPSFGGVETLVEQPAVMSYYEMTTEERASIGIDDGLVRISPSAWRTRRTSSRTSDQALKAPGSQRPRSASLVSTWARTTARSAPARRALPERARALFQHRGARRRVLRHLLLFEEVRRDLEHEAARRARDRLARRPRPSRARGRATRGRG